MKPTTIEYSKLNYFDKKNIKIKVRAEIPKRFKKKYPKEYDTIRNEVYEEYGYKPKNQNYSPPGQTNGKILELLKRANLSTKEISTLVNVKCIQPQLIQLEYSKKIKRIKTLPGKGGTLLWGLVK